MPAAPHPVKSRAFNTFRGGVKKLLFSFDLQIVFVSFIFSFDHQVLLRKNGILQTQKAFLEIQRTNAWKIKQGNEARKNSGYNSQLRKRKKSTGAAEDQRREREKELRLGHPDCLKGKTLGGDASETETAEEA